MIILQAKFKMPKEEVKNLEDKLSYRTGKKVVIIPSCLEFVDSFIEGRVLNVFNSLDSIDSKCSITND